MIKVIRLNGEMIWLNYFQIQAIEAIPETKIKMVDGTYYLVRDSVEAISCQVVEFLRNCHI